MSNIELDRLIELHDETLDELRVDWIVKKQINPALAAKALARIDKALDYRLKLMQARDGKQGKTA